MNAPVLTRQQVRELDRRAITEYGVPGLVLMENAGRGCAELLLNRLVQGSAFRGPVVLCCGKGNNGGDGFVIARHLHLAGVAVQVVLLGQIDQLAPDAAVNFQIVQHLGLPLTVVSPALTAAGVVDLVAPLFAQATWIVDALLGTGLSGPVSPLYSTAIEAMNSSGRPILAVDVPSGLDCDTGLPLGSCVLATLTATLAACKPGLLTTVGQGFCGELHVVHIGFPLLADHGLPGATAIPENRAGD